MQVRADGLAHRLCPADLPLPLHEAGDGAHAREGDAGDDGEHDEPAVVLRVAHVARVAPVVVDGDVPSGHHLGSARVEAFDVAASVGDVFDERRSRASVSGAVHGEYDGFGRCCGGHEHVAVDAQEEAHAQEDDADEGEQSFEEVSRHRSSADAEMQCRFGIHNVVEVVGLPTKVVARCFILVTTMCACCHKLGALLLFENSCDKIAKSLFVLLKLFLKI